MMGKINAFVAGELKQFINSFSRHKADSVSISERDDVIMGKQKEAHISAADAPIDLRAPPLASLAAY